jgi:YegS/Rv2252/BmrU family lipid kinase
MKHYFIINPAAGTGKNVPSLIEKIESICREKKAEFEIYLTKSVGDAADFVKKLCSEATERLRIYSCGGDGTNNEVISGASGSEFAEVGFVPDGTGNDFVKCFDDPQKFLDISAQLDARCENIDLISCDGNYVMNIMNMGFDCEVVRRMGKLKRSPLVPSSMAYVMGVVIELIRKPGIKLKVSLDGGAPEDKELLLSTFSNGRYYGGGFNASPKARLRDGLMDVCFVKNISRTKFISIVKHYKSGKYLDMEKFKNIVEFKRCKTAKLEFASDQSVCIDGELCEKRSIELKLLPLALKILIPKGCNFKEDESNAPEPLLTKA